MDRDGCETICNEREIFPSMRELVEKDGMSIRFAAKFINQNSSGLVIVNRAEQAYHRRKPSSHN